MPEQPPETAPEEPECTGLWHTVRIGDTLYMLARQYQITLDALMRANPNLDPYNLRVGMQLCIPVQGDADASISTEGCVPKPSFNNRIGTKVYKTQRGDSITRILDKYQITFAALQSSNPAVDFSGSLDNLALNIPTEDHFRTCDIASAYIVKSGDSLDSISKKLLVLTDSLVMANPTLATDDFTIPGTKVCIPL